MIRMKHTGHFSVILLVILLSLEKPYNTEALIGRGENTLVHRVKPDEFPFLASLSYKDERLTLEQNQFCTGTLVSLQHILTSAKCAVKLGYDLSEILIGSPSLRLCQKYQWESRTFYADWATRNNRSIDPANDDIAIVKLEKRVENGVPAILRAAPNSVKVGLMRIAGWGSVGIDRIKKPVDARRINVKILDTEDCKRLTSDSPTNEVSTYNWDRRICTGNRINSGYALLAKGDSGGPLIDKNNNVIGVNTNVAPENQPFTNQVNIHCTVRFYRDFIHDAQSLV